MLMGGKLLCGTCDQVHGLLYVATNFCTSTFYL